MPVKQKENLTVPATGDEKKQTVGSENMFVQFLRDRKKSADGLYLVKGVVDEESVILFVRVEGGAIVEAFDDFNPFTVEKGQVKWADVTSQNGNKLVFEPSPIISKIAVESIRIYGLKKLSADVTRGLPTGDRVTGKLTSTLKRDRY